LHVTRAAFTRASASERRQALIDATADTLARKGAGGVSVREICARAGVSPGLLRHYFSGIDALLAATYARTCADVEQALADAADAAGADPRDRLLAYIAASFAPPIATADLLATWIGFWGLVRSSPAMADIHAGHNRRIRETVESLVRAAAGDRIDTSRAAVGLCAMIDGLWLDLTLAPAGLTAAAARQVARDWIDALIP
jgi:TetR/AcrR family transcriptional repressor of bet genes